MRFAGIFGAALFTAVLAVSAPLAAFAQGAGYPPDPGLEDTTSPLKGRMLREGRRLKRPDSKLLLPAVQQDLSKALRLYDREVRRDSGSRLKGRMSVRPDMRVQGIIIINGKPDMGKKKAPDTKRSTRMMKRKGRIRPAPKLSSRGIIIVNRRPHALGRLQRAVHKFERALGPRHPQVRACRAKEGACMRRCRSTLRKRRINGQCSCIGVRAHCLSQVRFGDGRHGRRLPARQ